MNCYTNKFDISIEPKLKEFFIKEYAEFSPVQYAFWRAKTPKYNATFYNSGKLLIQGSNVSEISQLLENSLCIKKITNTINTQNELDLDIPTCHLGSDESGKGDFFGPLVIAAVLVNENNTEILQKSGIKDCKKINDKDINKLAAIVKNNCTFSIITINPTKYNELYGKFKNLNLLLAWGHARAIENILEKEDCDFALSDKFGDDKLIKNALMKKGKSLQLVQRHRAESDIAVAAASVIARAQFLKIMNELSDKYGQEIPKGASDKVLQTAKKIAEKFTKDELKNAVKLHFKTYSQV